MNLIHSIFSSPNTVILVAGTLVTLLTAFFLLRAAKVLYVKPSLVMSATTKDSIRALSSNPEEGVLVGLDLTQQALEKLYESDDALAPKEELLNDLMRLAEISDSIKQAVKPSDKSEIYYSIHRPFSDELKTKYSEFLPSDVIQEIQAHEKYMDGLRELFIAHSYMLMGFEEKDVVKQSSMLYTGMVRLSETAEEYLPYFPFEFVESIRDSAAAILSEPRLKPDKFNQIEKLFNTLTALKQVARGILWQVEHQQENLSSSEPATVGSILEYLKTAPKWEGDDFEECLKSVNDTRK